MEKEVCGEGLPSVAVAQSAQRTAGLWRKDALPGVNVAHLQRWTPAEVGKWLQSVGLGRLAPLFQEHNIAGDVLLDVTMEDLVDMGVVAVGDRRRLIRALEQLGKQARSREGPHLDVAVLGASPLVRLFQGGCSALEPIDTVREHERVCEVIGAGVDEAAQAIDSGTFEALSRVLQVGAMVLSLTAHSTQEGHLLLERQTGEAYEFDAAATLPEMLGLGASVLADTPRGVCQTDYSVSQRGASTLPVCVVLSLSGPGLLQVARAFIQSGARHVVTIARSPDAEIDHAAATFTASFLRGLLSGCTVADAFNEAQLQQRLAQNCVEEPRECALLPDDVVGRHDVALFQSSFLGFAECGSRSSRGDGDGEHADCLADVEEESIKPCAAVGDTAASATIAASGTANVSAGDTDMVRDSFLCRRPSLRSPRQERIKGRQIDVWQAVLALSKSRCVVICGVGGVGKAALCRTITAHLLQRRRKFCQQGVHAINMRGIRTVHAAESQLRHALGSVGSVDDLVVGAVTSDAISAESLEAFVGRFGERILIVESVEELLRSDPKGFAEFLDIILAAGPRLRLLLTSRRALPAGAWPARSHHLPFHIYLRQLEPRASAQLLSEFLPSLSRDLVDRIASICGYLPLALRVVGQRLAATRDQDAEAREFIAETSESPEKRASLLFSDCVAPYVWRSLDASRHAALVALSLFRASFEIAAAAAVLGVQVDRAQMLLREFQDQCLVERPFEGCFYMPTPVHLFVQKQFSNTALVSSAAHMEHVHAAQRFILFVATLIRDVARATASDRGRGRAGLEDLRTFDRHRVDIDLALVLAGTSDLFVLMTQFGRDVFDTRLSPQRRIAIYERLLGILMTARKAQSSIVTPRVSTGIVNLVRRFERQGASGDCRRSAAQLGANAVRSAADHVRSRPRASWTTPTTPVAAPRTTPTTPTAHAFAVPEDAGSVCSLTPGFASHSVPSSPSKSVLTSAGLFPAAESRLPSMKCSSPAVRSSGVCEEPLDPSYVFAAANGDDDICSQERLLDAEVYSTGPRGIVAVKPAWCPVLTAADNEQLRPLLEHVIVGSPKLVGSGSNSGVDIARSPCRESHGEAKMFGECAALTPGRGVVWWHEQKAHDSALVEVLLRLGAAHSALGRFAHAAQLLRKALILSEEMAQKGGAISGLSAEAVRAELLGALSGVLCQQGLTQKAEAMLWQARQLAKHSGHKELYLKLTSDLAEFNRRVGNLRAAERLFRLGMKTLDLENIDTASTLNAFGVFLAQKGDFDEAKKLIMDAIKIRIKLLGKSHLSVAEAYHNLGTVHESLHNHADAAQLYEAALQVKRGALPEGHLSIADTKNQLSALYSKMKRHEQCIRLLRDCLSQHLAAVGETHVSTAAVMFNLGNALHIYASETRDEVPVCTYLARLNEAQLLLNRALAVRKSNFHKRHPCIAECRGSLGHVYFKKQELDNAEKHFRAALRLSRRHYGQNHPDVAVWSFWLGKAHLEMQRIAQGKEHLRAAMGVVETLAERRARGASGQPVSPLVPEQLEELRALLKRARTPAGSPTAASVGMHVGVESPAGAGIRSAPLLGRPSRGRMLGGQLGSPVLTTTVRPKQAASSSSDQMHTDPDELVESEPAAEPPSHTGAEDAPPQPPTLAGRPRPACLMSPSPSPNVSSSNASDSDGLPTVSETAAVPRKAAAAPGSEAATMRPILESPSGESRSSARTPSSVWRSPKAGGKSPGARPSLRSPKARSIAQRYPRSPQVAATHAEIGESAYWRWAAGLPASPSSTPATLVPPSSTTSSSSDCDEDDDGNGSSGKASQQEVDASGEVRTPSHASYSWIMRYVRKSAAEYQSGQHP